MSRVRDGVKFGASRMCPKCNSGFGSPATPREPQHRTTCRRGFEMHSMREQDDIGIRRAQGRTGKIRADVRTRAWPAGGVTRPSYECPGSGGPARSLLHEPAQSDSADDGPAHHHSRVSARERIGAIRDGRTTARKRNEGKLKIGKVKLETKYAGIYSGCKKGFK